MSNDDQKNVWIINFCMLVSWPHFSGDHSHNTFNHRCHCDMGVPAVWASPFPKPLVIWTSPVTLTLSQIAKLIKEGDAHISRALRMEIPKTRGCPYHCNTGSGKVFPSSGIWTKYSAGFGKPLTGYGIWLLPGRRDSPKFGYECGIGKENDQSGWRWWKFGTQYSLEKERECGIGPPSPSFSLFRPYNMDSLGTKIRLVELFKSQLLNPSRPSPPPPLRPYRWETWYFYQSSSFLMLLGCLRQNRYHRWEIFKVINTEYLYLC